MVDLFASTETTSAPSRGTRRRDRRRRRRGSIIAVIAGLLVLAVVVAGVAAAPSFLKRFRAKDYTGTGAGTVLIQVKDGQTTSDIASTLVAKGVVASSRAFINAAKSSGKASDFQAGYFTLKQRMAAKAAVSSLLNPSNRVSYKLTVIEGLIAQQILPMLAKTNKLSGADLLSASKQVDQLGVPDGYSPKSIEGFLFPQTYEFDPNLTALDVLQQLVAEYAAVDKQIGFDTGAAALKMAPYQVLIIASIVEKEAKFDGDRAKVARVLLNRYVDHDALGSDATSVYGALISGENPKDLTYNEKTPYNTRHEPGLPPTPISNPGQASMLAASHPASGNWHWFVSKDAAGHLFFTNSYPAFLKAKDKCKAQGWGCG